MVIGDPYYCAINFEIVYQDNQNSNMGLGIFNFIIEDVFFPGRGANYTINMVINHLTSNLEIIESIDEISDDLLIDNDRLFTSIANSFDYYLNTDSENLINPNEIKNKCVDLTPLEYADLGYYIFYIKTVSCDFLYYSYDYGLSSLYKKLTKGYLYDLIRQLNNYQLKN